MEDNKQENPQKPVVVYGVVNIGCDQTGATFQTLVEAPKGTKTEEAEVEEVFVPRQLHFFDMVVFGSEEKQPKLIAMLKEVPGQLTKVKQEEPKGDKRYKSYTEALASECGYWFILDECLPEMAEWRSLKFNYRVDDNRRSRIQNLVKEVYQGLKDAES